MKKHKKTKELLLWKGLSNFWGCVAAIAFMLTFFNVLDISHILTDITIIYLSILTIFTGLKEYNRWKEKKFFSKSHGEIFIITWTILMVAFIIISAYDKTQYKMATEFTATYLSVMGIFAISKKSKNLRAQ